MKYRLLAADLDGTLVTDKKELTQETKEAISEMIARGGIMMLASGRPTPGTFHVARELMLDQKGGYALAYNGGELMDLKTGKVLFSNEIPPERIGQIMELAHRHRVAILTYEGPDIITESPEDFYVNGEAVNVRMNVRGVPDLVAAIKAPIVKMMMVGSEERILEMEPIVREALGEEFEVFRSEAYHLEIQPAGINKGSGLTRALELLGIPAEETIACGDYDNDIPMLEAAGLGVSMANGCPQIKKHADYMTASNEEDGVARVIRSFILEETL